MSLSRDGLTVHSDGLPLLRVSEGGPERDVPGVDDVLPWFYQTFPVTSVNITLSSVTIGNKALPTFSVATFSSVQVLHTAELTSAPYSPYKILTKLRNVKVRNRTGAHETQSVPV